jgi:ribosomal protein RSM22 (predicted rRNA methylase)
VEPTGDLPAALDAVLGDLSGAGLQRAAERLTSAYRSDALPGDVLTTPEAARAYAAYRMPATAAAVRAALRAAGLGNPPPPGTAVPATPAPDPGPPTPLPGRPETNDPPTSGGGGVGVWSHLDVGGGTGAAVWAVAGVVPGVVAATVVDRSRDALDLGRALAARSGSAVVRGATWTQAHLGGPLPAADLVTMAYVLAELPAAARAALVGGVEAGIVAIVEPGTPAGYRRVLDARAVLLERGYRILAPCPHDARCPLAGTADWCHFAARLPRSARHRQAKGGTLGWEDEKFSYVVATRAPATPAPGRILRHPAQRKGLVELTVCAPAGIEPVKVSKRQGPLYRAARDAGWGDPWPPEEPR